MEFEIFWCLTLISGSIWPTGFGRICGINPDQHFYVHIGKEEDFKHIDISITTVRINKSYKFGKIAIRTNKPKTREYNALVLKAHIIFPSRDFQEYGLHKSIVTSL